MRGFAVRYPEESNKSCNQHFMSIYIPSADGVLGRGQGRGGAPPSRASAGDTLAPKRRLPKSALRAASTRCATACMYARPLSAMYAPARVQAYRLGAGASASRYGNLQRGVRRRQPAALG